MSQGRGTKVEEKLCMLCCYLYVPNKKRLPGLIAGCRFRRFCKELECCLKEKKLKMNKSTSKTVQKCRLRGDLNLDYDNVSVCVSCIRLIESAMEHKLSAASVEERVRKLQIQVLAELQDLEGFVQRFYREMTKIESVVSTSDETKLLSYLDEIPIQLRSDIIRFRERILEAVDDLKLYREELDEKTDCTSSAMQKFERERILRRRRDRIHQTTQTEAVKEDHCVNVNKRTQTETFEDYEQMQVKVEVDEAGNCCSDDNEMYDGSANEFNEADAAVDENHEGGNNQEGNVGPQREKSNFFRRSLRPRRLARNKKSKATIPSTSGDESNKWPSESDTEGSVSDSGSNFSDVDPKVRQMKESTLAISNVSLLDGINFEEMTVFKKKIVTRVIQRLENAKPSCDITAKEQDVNNAAADTDTIIPDNIEDPRSKYVLQYDVESDTLRVNDIKIIVIENDEMLQCSVCPFVVEKCGKNCPELKIYDHVLGKHFDAYNCEDCGKKLASWHLYWNHVMGHKNPKVCDICGKPFRVSRSVELHRLLHMNEVERAEAIKEDPRLNTMINGSRNKPNKNHQCTTCGKSFPTRGALEQHERIHENRERIMCPLCGKMCLPGMSIMYHEKYSCAFLESRRVQCHICKKTYKNDIIRRRHIVLCHTDNSRLFTCLQCCKKFKTKNLLNRHMKITHSHLRPYSCSKACGAAFKTKGSAKRHEHACKYNNQNRKRHITVKSDTNSEHDNTSYSAVPSTSHSLIENRVVQPPNNMTPPDYNASPMQQYINSTVDINQLN